MAFLKILDSRGNRIPAAASYEGASYGRRLADWGVSSAGPNAAVGGSLSTLRARQRELSRNNPLAAGGGGLHRGQHGRKGHHPPLANRGPGLERPRAGTLGRFRGRDGRGRRVRLLRPAGPGGPRHGKRRRGPGPLPVPPARGPAGRAVAGAGPGRRPPGRILFNTPADNGNEIRMGIEFDRLRAAGRLLALSKTTPASTFLTRGQHHPGARARRRDPARVPAAAGRADPGRAVVRPDHRQAATRSTSAWTPSWCAGKPRPCSAASSCAPISITATEHAAGPGPPAAMTTKRAGR